MTVLSVAQDIAARLQLTQPTTLLSVTDANTILIKTLMKQAVSDLVSEFAWPELQKIYSFTLIAGQDSYALPTDMERTLTETLWNTTQRWPLNGPLTAREWQTYKSGLVTTIPRQRFRIKGWTNKQFFIDPVPTSSEASQIIVFEYVTSLGIRPTAWTASTAFTLNEYRSWNDNVYKCTSAGTGSTRPPTVYNGLAKDNTTMWQFMPPWVTATLYNVGDYVSANSKVYICTVAGVSGGAAPSHTSGTATDGTVTWGYQATPSAWVAGTNYTTSSYVSNAGGFFKCYLDGLSGTIGPRHTLTVETDGAADWTYQSSYTPFQIDTEEIVLDNNMVVDNVVWMFKRARGDEYEDDRRDAEEQKELAKSRLGGSEVLSLNSLYSDTYMIGPWSYPEGNY